MGLCETQRNKEENDPMKIWENIQMKNGQNIQMNNVQYNQMKNGQISQNPSEKPNINLSTITNINSSQGSYRIICFYNFYDNNNNGYFINNIQDSYPNNNSRLLKPADNKLNNERDNLMNETRKVKEQNNELQNKLKNKDNIIKQKDDEIKKLQKDVLELRNKENEYITKFNNIIMENKTKYNNKISELLTEIEKYKNKKTNELEQLKRVNSLQIMKKELPILVGLNNIGATCYMNATLQCLSNTTKLREYFLKMFKYEINNKNKIISNEFYNVIKNLWDINNTNRSFSPYSFKEKLSQENPLFKGIQANDSKDLINFLLERIHLELNEPREDQNNNIMKNFEITQSVQLNEALMLKNIYK